MTETNNDATPLYTGMTAEELREILLTAYQLKCAELAHQRQVTEDAEVRLMAMNARLAAQSGYAENEAHAEMQAALIAQYDAIKSAVVNAPVVVRLDTHEMYNTILDAIAKHDPRKGAE